MSLDNFNFPLKSGAKEKQNSQTGHTNIFVNMLSEQIRDKQILYEYEFLLI